jgi:hypothetical protein
VLPPSDIAKPVTVTVDGCLAKAKSPPIGMQ